MRRDLPTFFLFTALLSLTANADADIQHAELAALEWLAALDRGEVVEAWSSSSSLLKASIGPEDLADAIQAARRGFGAVLKRERMGASRESSLPGVPDGDYIVLTFQTEFENKRRSVETVTPRLEEGVWKVSGYYVK